MSEARAERGGSGGRSAPGRQERRIEVLESRVRLHERFAEVVSAALRDAVSTRGEASLALSRGDGAFRSLAAADVPWTHVHVFQVDERSAADDSTDRNLTAIERDLLARIPPPGPRMHAMPVDEPLEESAAAYAAELESVCGSPPALDVAHLGLGGDGHTASLFASDRALEVRDPSVVATAEHHGFHRVTLTVRALSEARLVVFLVSGAAKAQAVRSLVASGDPIPAARIRARDVLMLVDREAASLVPDIVSPL